MMDYTVGDTIRKCFTTRAFGSGAPTTLAGTPVLSVYEDGNITQIIAGVSVTVDFDGVAGLNQLVIVAIGANGFATGSDYSVVITTGTVGGVSVVGETVYTFSLGRSAAAVDLANVTDGLGAIKTSVDAIPTTAMRGTDGVDTTAMRGTDSAALASVATEVRLAELDAANMPAVLDAVKSDTDDIQTRLPGVLVGGRMDSDLGAISTSATAADNLEESALGIVPGAAVGTPTVTVIGTDLTETTTDHFKGRILTFNTGAVAGQSTDITGYNGTTKELTVTALTNPPAATDKFVIT